MKDIMHSFFRSYVSEFSKLTKGLPRISGGISKSEAFAFSAFCKMFDIDLVIESGTGRGISTEYFVRVLDHLITIDNHRHYNDSLEISLKHLHDYDNMTYIIGNSYKVIPFLLQTMNYKRCAIFFDGPKGRKAFTWLSNKGLEIYFAGFHDVSIGSPNWDFFKDKNVFFHTHDQWFLDEFGVLDKHEVKTKDFQHGPGTIFWKNK